MTRDPDQGYEVMGIWGDTRREAFHGLVTRVRRHIAWRLIRPELKAYLEGESESWSNPECFRVIHNFERWISGPAKWSKDDWWRDDS